MLQFFSFFKLRYNLHIVKFTFFSLCCKLHIQLCSHKHKMKKSSPKMCSYAFVVRPFLFPLHWVLFLSDSSFWAPLYFMAQWDRCSISILPFPCQATESSFKCWVDLETKIWVQDALIAWDVICCWSSCPFRRQGQEIYVVHMYVHISNLGLFDYIFSSRL